MQLHNSCAHKTVQGLCFTPHAHGQETGTKPHLVLGKTILYTVFGAQKTRTAQAEKHADMTRCSDSILHQMKFGEVKSKSNSRAAFDQQGGTAVKHGHVRE